jgi:hypothetical protein
VVFSSVAPPQAHENSVLKTIEVTFPVALDDWCFCPLELTVLTKNHAMRVFFGRSLLPERTKRVIEEWEEEESDRDIVQERENLPHHQAELLNYLVSEIL